MHRQKRLLFMVQLLLAITLIGPIVGPVFAQSPGYLAAAPADSQLNQAWQEDGLRLPDSATTESFVDGPIDLPASAGSLEELVPAGFTLQSIKQSAIVSPAGGAFLFSATELLLLVPKDAFAEPVQLTISPVKTPAAAEVSQTFQINAYTLANGTERQPERSLLLALDAGTPLPAGSYFGQLDQAGGRWLVPSLSQHGATLYALNLPNLGSWSLVQPDAPTGETPSPWRYEWQVPAVSQFSGAATFQYPIELPAGRGDLTPNIDVSYNSAALNGLIFNDGQDIGPLGSGWALNHIEISRQLVEVGQNGSWFLNHGDRFALVLNGQSYQLERTGSAENTSRYMAVNGPNLKIELHRANPAATPGLNSHGLYWTVTTGNGTVYRLGYTEAAETGQGVPHTHTWS